MNDVLGKLIYIYNRLNEPSSRVAFGGAFAVLSKYVPAEVLQDGLSIAALLFFTVGVFTKEGKPESVALPGWVQSLPTKRNANPDH